MGIALASVIDSLPQTPKHMRSHSIAPRLHKGLGLQSVGDICKEESVCEGAGDSVGDYRGKATNQEMSASEDVGRKRVSEGECVGECVSEGVCL